ncbi:MAG: hypothetical protein IKK63_02480 [Clostridia bacterium]|nr:hypothetical protein [Clostridia bacterium]
MAERNTERNITAQNRSKKMILTAVAVVCALSVLIIIFLICKNSLCLSVSQHKTERHDYSGALELIEDIHTEKSDALALYLTLRNDINERYPVLLTDFNPSIIAEWTQAISAVEDVKHLLSDEIALEAEKLSETLHRVNSCLTQYDQIRTDIISLMDIFAEINRLYTKAPDGKNVSFTVSEERLKISLWEQQISTVYNYANTIPGYENIYLLNYLIKEAEGECLELQNSMDSVIAKGYKDTDLIRLSGSGQKQFPAITNSNNESVNLLQKELYEKYLYDGICVQLASVLGVYYEV